MDFECRLEDKEETSCLFSKANTIVIYDIGVVILMLQVLA